MTSERQTALLDRIGAMRESGPERHPISIMLGVYGDTDLSACETQELFRTQLTEDEALELAKRIRAMNPTGK